MDFYYDRLDYRNVISKRYIVNNDIVFKAEEDFIASALKEGYKITSPLTYYIEADNKEEFTITFLTEVKNNSKIEGSTCFFRSYYSLGDVITCRVPAKELANKNIYEEMSEYVKKDNLKLISPVHFSLEKQEDKYPYYLVRCAVFID